MSFADSKKWLKVFRFFLISVAVCLLLAAAYAKYEAVPAVKAEFKNTLISAQLDGEVIDKRDLRRSALQQIQILDAITHVSLLAAGLNLLLSGLLFKAPVLLAFTNLLCLLGLLVVLAYSSTELAVYVLPIGILLLWLASRFLRASTVYQRGILQLES